MLMYGYKTKWHGFLLLYSKTKKLVNDAAFFYGAERTLAGKQKVNQERNEVLTH